MKRAIGWLGVLLLGCPSAVDDDDDVVSCDDSVQARVDCVDDDRVWADLLDIADVRTPASAHWQSVQDLCATRLEAAGFTVERQAYDTGVNVVGRLPGASDTQVVVGAHYDAVPSCAGADDNGTGVAAALEVARLLGGSSYDKTLVVACWDEEEDGLLGSTAWVAANTAPVALAVSFEMLGYVDATPGAQQFPSGSELLLDDMYPTLEKNEFRGDFLAWIGDADSAAFGASLASWGARVGLNVLGQADDAFTSGFFTADMRRSDHAPFWAAGVPAVMLTDTANFRNPHYHCGGGPDAPDDLDRGFLADSVRASLGAIAEALGATR